MSVKSAVPLALSHVSRHGFFFLQCCARTSLLKTWTSTCTLPSVVGCLRQCFPGAPSPWLRVAGAGSWAMSGPRSASLLPNAQSGRRAKAFPGSLGV